MVSILGRYRLLIGFFVSLSIAFVLGMHFYKQGYHYKVFSFYYDKYREAPEPLEFVLPEDAINQRAAENNHCGCPKINNAICPCGSGSNFSRPEVPILDDLLKNGPPRNYEPRQDFSSYLQSALGWDNLHPTRAKGGAAINTISEAPYRGGTISNLRISFSKPRVQTEALFAKHSEKPDTVILIVHGHVSNMFKVAGLDVPDYMRAAGAHWFNKGADTIAFNLTSSNPGSGRINRLLMSYGSHINGLWVRTVCDTAKALALRNSYRNVYVYGISNGGVIADQISIVCEPFDLVVVGDIFSDLRKAFWNILAENSGQEYSYYFNRPVLFDSSYVDFLAHSRSKKIYTRTDMFLSRFPFESAKSLRKIPFAEKNRINFLYKKHKEHIVELELMDDLFFGDWNRLRGFGLSVRFNE